MGTVRRGARRMMAIAAIAATAVLITACTGPTVTVRPTMPPQADGGFGNGVTSRLNAALKNAMTLSGSSGAIAGVWAPWAGSWVVSPGTAGHDDKTPMTTSMRFRIASNTQSMTCTVLLALVDAGTVSLDDPVTKYLKRMAGVDGITLRELCQNTSGLGQYSAGLETQFVNNPTRQWPQLELLSDALVTNAVGAPGKQWSPADGGFVLLGMALEAATSESWASLYKKYVFEPLGLMHTSYPPATKLTIPGAHPNGYATALDQQTGKVLCGTTNDDTLLSPSMAVVSGGVISGLDDLKLYSRALAAGTLVSKKSSSEQWKTVPLGGSAPSWEGAGLGVLTFGPLRGTAGAMPGFLSATLTEPKSGLTIVVMLNNSTDGAAFIQQLALQLAAIVATVPATKGNAPVIALPWSEKQAADALTKLAVCPPVSSTATPKPKH